MSLMTFYSSRYQKKFIGKKGDFALSWGIFMEYPTIVCIVIVYKRHVYETSNTIFEICYNSFCLLRPVFLCVRVKLFLVFLHTIVLVLPTYMHTQYVQHIICKCNVRTEEQDENIQTFGNISIDSNIAMLWWLPAAHPNAARMRIAALRAMYA